MNNTRLCTYIQLSPLLATTCILVLALSWKQSQIIVLDLLYYYQLNPLAPRNAIQEVAF